MCVCTCCVRVCVCVCVCVCELDPHLQISPWAQAMAYAHALQSLVPLCLSLKEKPDAQHDAPPLYLGVCVKWPARELHVCVHVLVCV